MDYNYENWVMREYVLKNPRLLVIKERLDTFPFLACPKPLEKRYFTMCSELLNSYRKDPHIKKMYKAYLAIDKMLNNV